MSQPDRLVDVSVVAKRFSVAEETVRAWIRRGRLVAIVTPSGRYRIRLSVVDRFDPQDSQDSQTET